MTLKYCSAFLGRSRASFRTRPRDCMYWAQAIGWLVVVVLIYAGVKVCPKSPYSHSFALISMIESLLTMSFPLQSMAALDYPGPYCLENGILTDALLTDVRSLPVLKEKGISKGIVLELSAFRRQNNIAWDVFDSWLKHLCSASSIS